ncbi:methyltransferase domain-containing protein [Candidatus Woesearchaeota archaeon]|nr:methyltransferase domain-containing protein [Candidatus Woesearchaeota archaeon]
MTRINFFHQSVPEICDLFKDEVIRRYVESTLAYVLNELEIEEPGRIIDEVIELATTYVNIERDYEKPAHDFLVKEGVTEKIPEKLSNRAELIYSQISPHLLPGLVLDMGCGDGKVGELAYLDRHAVTLADVYEHKNILDLCTRRSGLDFVLFEQGKEVPITEKYDNALLLTVNHHSNNPMQTTLDTARLVRKGGRIIVIESVYGIKTEQEEDIHYGERSAMMGLNFKLLDHEKQMFANIFFDHFYNRVIHYSDDPKNKVNVPFNFCTPGGWKMFFEDLGLEQERVVYLGNDQLTVPEYHTLHVLKK